MEEEREEVQETSAPNAKAKPNNDPLGLGSWKIDLDLDLGLDI